MKRKRIIVVILAMVILLAGCAAQPAMEPYDIRSEMYDMSRQLGDKSNIVDIDIATLSDFFASIEATKYRLRGMVTEYKAEKNFLGNYMVSCYLLCDDITVSVVFADSESTSDGEYIEIVGELLGTGYGGYSNRASFAIGAASIVERGASVRERIEQD